MGAGTARRFENLYMCGSATHPGGGIMGAPGRNAALEILGLLRGCAASAEQVTDVIFVGGGHNGLTAAAVLARRGVKTLVLEARATVGGAAITEELHPGFKISTLAHAAQPAAALMTELRLADHGLELIEPDPYLFAPLPDGRSLVLGRDVDATANSIATFSAEDARRYPEFCATLARVRAFAGDVMANTPPDIEQPSNADLWSMVMMGRRFRGLGKEGCVSPAEMGADVRGRFRVGMVRVGTAACCHRGRRHFRNRARTAIRRQRCGAADADGRGRWPAAARARRTRIADVGARVSGPRRPAPISGRTPKCAGST